MPGGLDIVLDYAFPNVGVGYLPVVTRGLKEGHFFGVDGPTTLKNQIDPLDGGVGDGAIVGTPTYTTNAVTFSSTVSYLQTPLPETAEMTFIGMSRSHDDGLGNSTIPILVGNLTLNASGFALMIRDDGAGRRLHARRTTLVNGTVTTTNVKMGTSFPVAGDVNADGTANINDEAWFFWAVVFSVAEGKIRLYDFTRNLSIEIVVPGTPIMGGNVRFGSMVNTYAGSQQSGLAFAYQANLTVPELTAQVAQFRSFAATWGVAA